MSREEAIAFAESELKAAYERAEKIGYKRKTRYIEVLEMAIKALKQEPTVIATGDGAYYNIKALEQQSMPTLVLPDVDKKVESYKKLLKHPAIVIKHIMDETIEALPPVTPQQTWIPVSERLPEEGVDVLACFYTGERNYKMMVSRRSDYNYWNGVGRTSDMVAWMPLPEPWKGE